MSKRATKEQMWLKKIKTIFRNEEIEQILLSEVELMSFYRNALIFTMDNRKNELNLQKDFSSIKLI